MSRIQIFGVNLKQIGRLLSVGDEQPGIPKQAPPSSGSDLKFGTDLEHDESRSQHERVSAEAESLEQPGSSVGHYKLLRILGEGGMGIVYLAEQQEPVKRQVALKVVKPGMDSKRVINRFETERQVLAILDHPNIAHVYDAGTTESGRPYFVMECVEGLPFTKHCDNYKLSINDRLKLFLQVCQAVQHAHQKGIIHRDIKPSNILVSIQDNQAIPKVIDFGVAKAIGKSLTEHTFYTEDNQFLGTPEYMSPEQTSLSNEDIDVRSDVYSLGALLYVLLAGVLPFDSTRLRQGGIDVVRQVIQAEDPKTPSTRLNGLTKEARQIAENRRTNVQALTQRLHRELEWIPLKAMEKDRERRYQSASELAQDVRNYLNGSPLLAGPPGVLYRLAKFGRRNRVFVVAAVIVLTVMCVGTVVSTLFGMEARRQARTVVTINTFFNENLLGSLSTLKNKVGEVTVVSVLNMASESLGDQFRNDPLVEAAIHQTLADSYHSLTEFDSAEKHQEPALQIRREYLGENHPDTLASMYRTATLYWNQSRYDDGAHLALRTFEGYKCLLGPAHARTLLAMRLLGRTYKSQARLPEAQEVLEEGVRVASRALGEEHKYTLLFAGDLAGLYRDQGHLKKAEELLENMLPAYRRVWGQEHPNTLNRMHILGLLYLTHKNPADAEPILKEQLEIRQRVMGEEHLNTLDAMRTLGACYRLQGRYEEAEPLVVRVNDIMTRKYGEEHRSSLYSTANLATLRVKQKRYEEAEILLVKVIEGWSRLVSEEHHETLRQKHALGDLYIEQGRYAEAEPLLRVAFEGQNAKLGRESRLTLFTANSLGVLYTKQGRFDEAEPLLLQAVEGQKLNFGIDHPDTLTSLHNLIGLYEAWNKSEQANQWRAELP